MRHNPRSLIALLTVAMASAAAAADEGGCFAAPWRGGGLPEGPSPAWTVAGAFGTDDPAAICFAPETDPETVAAFRAAMDGVGPRSNPVDRWGSTAHGSTGPDGTPITLTYSFVPDGTSIPESSWTAGGSSSLHSFLDGIYGTPDVWKPIIGQAFDRWSAVTGITFVHEPNDDGTALSSGARGILGVRGDIRLSAVHIDGTSNILAYNYYPDYGDMVLDAGDGWYNTITNNSRRLRNLITHEVGHGIGLAHVCPIQQNKVMEPFLSTNFDGPQHDDIRGVQFLYGDTVEPDDSAAQAVDLGELPDGPILVGAPPPPSVSLGTTRGLVNGSDEDWLRFTVDSPTSLLVTLVPVGTNYYDGEQDCPDQSGDCCRGTLINSRTVLDINVQILDAAASVLAEADAAAPGFSEHIPEVVLQPGTFYVRIAGAGTIEAAQLYTLTLAREEYVPATCACETGGDAGAVDVFDLLAYLDGWFVGADAAERTGDAPAHIDVFDLLSFLDCWFPASAGAACP